MHDSWASIPTRRSKCTPRVSRCARVRTATSTRRSSSGSCNLPANSSTRTILQLVPCLLKVVARSLLISSPATSAIVSAKIWPAEPGFSASANSRRFGLLHLVPPISASRTNHLPHCTVDSDMANRSRNKSSASRKKRPRKQGAPSSTTTASPTPPKRRIGETIMKVRVRMYRQGLGDCFLVTFDFEGEEKHMLIDCGSLGATTTGVKLSDVLEDIGKTTGKHIHLLLATHEHWDHVR